MLISPAEAIRRFNVSKPTLYSDMKEGKLSFKIDGRKKRKLDISELERIYDGREESAGNKNVKEGGGNTKSNVNPDLSRIALLEQEISFLKQQVTSKSEQEEKWQEAFEKAQKTADRVTALLTDQSKDKESRVGDQDKRLEALEKANEDLRKQNRRVLYELKAQKDLNLWEKIFGKKDKASSNQKTG